MLRAITITPAAPSNTAEAASRLRQQGGAIDAVIQLLEDRIGACGDALAQRFEFGVNAAADVEDAVCARPNPCVDRAGFGRDFGQLGEIIAVALDALDDRIERDAVAGQCGIVLPIGDRDADLLAHTQHFGGVACRGGRIRRGQEGARIAEGCINQRIDAFDVPRPRYRPLGSSRSARHAFAHWSPPRPTAPRWWWPSARR